MTAQELSASLSPAGKQYSYQTTSDLGTFTPNNTFTSQYIGLSATGYYFDEVVNAISTGPVTLNGYSDLSATTVHSDTVAVIGGRKADQRDRGR